MPPRRNSRTNSSRTSRARSKGRPRLPLLAANRNWHPSGRGCRVGSSGVLSSAHSRSGRTCSGVVEFDNTFAKVPCPADPGEKREKSPPSKEENDGPTEDAGERKGDRS